MWSTSGPSTYLGNPQQISYPTQLWFVLRHFHSVRNSHWNVQPDLLPKCFEVATMIIHTKYEAECVWGHELLALFHRNKSMIFFFQHEVTVQKQVKAGFIGCLSGDSSPSSQSLSQGKWELVWAHNQLDFALTQRQDLCSVWCSLKWIEQIPGDSLGSYNSARETDA